MSTAESIDQAVRSAKLRIEAAFIPLSRSRYATAKYPSLNWKIRLMRGDAQILTTDYSSGCGNTWACRASVKELGGPNCIMRDEALRRECETGRNPVTQAPHMPDSHAVLYCILGDAGAIDEGTFETWCEATGFDTDSRKAEAIYNQCIDMGLRLRRALGETALNELRAAFADY